MRWFIIAVVTPIILAVCVAGLFDWHEHSPAGRRATFLRMLADTDVSGDSRLTVEIRNHPAAVVAAGERACRWARSHPQYSYDSRLRARYDTMTHPPSLGAGQADADIPGYIAEVAWDHLCPRRQVDENDD
jgi:hypothetical protein